MSDPLRNAIASEALKRWSLLKTVALVTAQPSVFAERLAADNESGIRAALGFFGISVGIVLAIEAAFSFAFQTEFSDLVHHLFAVFVALTGGVAVFCLLKTLFTRSATFNGTMRASLYVGATALLVMTTVIFALLTADFAQNHTSVMTSGCETRTIMCLLSGNRQDEYGIIGNGGTAESQGWSYTYIVLVILGCLILYTRALAVVMKRTMSVPRWRTCIATFASVIVLSPMFIIGINLLYRALYKT
jgi:hypothetical protein